jgi:hypothetical protein
MSDQRTDPALTLGSGAPAPPGLARVHHVALPPDIDVYVQLPERDERVLVGFLDEYMPDWRTADRWLEAKPPQDAIARGLEGSTEEFALYGRVDTMPGVDFAVVAFPADGSLVLGLSVDGRP